MPEQPLRTFLIPFQNGQAILPNSSMVEVLPYATPLRLANAPPWVVGTMLWRALNVPLISLECLVSGPQNEAESYSRIVMVNTLGNDPRLLYLGLLGTDAPHLVNLERQDIVLDDTAEPPGPGVLSRVRVKEQPALIPDLEALEAALRPLMHQHG